MVGAIGTLPHPRNQSIDYFKAVPRLVTTSLARPPAWLRTESWAATNNSGLGLELAGRSEVGNRKHLQ